MAVADYDPDRHHVGLGTSVDDLRGFVTVGPHSKQLASPIFEKPSNVGTDDLIGARNYSVWTQNDYTGGEFQEDWSDPAMFSECVMMLPDPLGKGLRTTRPMVTAQLGDAVADTVPVSMEVVDGYIFAIFNNAAPAGRVYRYDPTDPAAFDAETISNAYLPTGKKVTAAFWNQSSEHVWIGTNKPRIHSFKWDQTQADGSRFVHTQDLGKPDSNDPITHISGIHLFGKLRFCSTAHGGGQFDDNRLWIFVSGSGDNAKWTQVGVLPGPYVASVTYNNAVYFLTRSGNSRTQLSMSQGDQIFPVLDFPYAFRGYSMCEYAGRLYIGGVGYDLNGDANHGELYEVSGTSLRLVRTWAGEVARPPADVIGNDQNGDPYDGTGWPGIPAPIGGPIISPGVGVPPPPPPPPRGHAVLSDATPHRPVMRQRVMTHMRDLVVAEGLLWMPDSSWTGLEAYDATTDAFYGGPRLRDGDDSGIEFTHLLGFGSSIYAFGTSSVVANQGLYRTEEREDAGVYYPFFTTSDFAPEPSRQKFWNRFTTLTRGDGAPYLDYSTDSGQSWFRLDPAEEIAVGYRVESTWDLSAIAPSRAVRFRITWAMPGTYEEVQGELIAHSLSFLVRGEDKKRWVFTVNASAGVGDLDDRLLEQSPSDVKTFLWALKGETSPVQFRDVDGVDYNVIVADISENHPAIDPDGEAYLPITLIEV